ncbi:MAG TPA: TlpA family protein disulfide reductase [Flavobacteriia bacterium]|nr:TlpA family protein disulfide reductase [Flavobacteriia bacterium]
MKKILLIFFLLTSTMLFSQNKKFNETILQSSFIDLNGNEINFEEILGKHKGKKIILEIWASWCSDCVAAMPKVKALQKKYGDTVDFVFISMDKSFKAFQDGIEKHQLEGDHYYSKTPWKESEFAKNIKLDWIPRYLVLDEEGNILLYKAVKPDDEKLIQLLN